MLLNRPCGNLELKMRKPSSTQRNILTCCFGYLFDPIFTEQFSMSEKWQSVEKVYIIMSEIFLSMCVSLQIPLKINEAAWMGYWIIWMWNIVVCSKSDILPN